jgi:hypothetical protein
MSAQGKHKLIVIAEQHDAFDKWVQDKRTQAIPYALEVMLFAAYQAGYERGQKEAEDINHLMTGG